MSDDLTGKTIGEYRILAAVGEGGMGVVYAGLNERINKKVAIKVLKGAGVEQDRLIAEAVAVNQVGHRNVVSIFGSGVLDDGRRYLVMEYLVGEPLDVYLQRMGKLPPREVGEFLQDVCAPLYAAHQAGIVHRDLKPANVFLVKQAGEAPFVKVLDFGLARQNVATDGYDESQTRDLVLEGTPEYMSPEQCTAQPVGASTDLYAVGTIAYELLTGAPPFRMEGAAPIEIMTAKVRRDSPRLQPPVPAQLADLVAALLQRKPLDRPQSAEAVRNQLRRIARMIREGAPDIRVTGSLERKPIPEKIAPAAAPAPAPARRRRRRGLTRKIAIATASGLVVALGVAAVLMITGRPTAPRPLPPVVVAKPPEPKPPPVEEPDELLPTLPQQVDEGVDAGAVVAADPVRPRRPPPPSLDELQKRLAAMEARHQKLNDPDPDAKVQLSSFRVRITVVSTPAERSELMRDFVAWEKKFAR